MTYDEFKQTWIWALQQSSLPIIGPDPVNESLDLRTMDRTGKSFVEPSGLRHEAEPFHATAAVEYRWDALQTARARTTEDDLLHVLHGLDRTRKPRTELPWLRVDVTLRASTLWGKESPLPLPSAWQRWAHEVLGRLESIEPVIPEERVRERRNGLPEILAWQSEPELRVLCKPDGALTLRGVEIHSWQGISLPRKWSDPNRKPDESPDKQLLEMFKRLRLSLHAWVECLDHLVT